jgi:hypothetical protein
MLRVMHSHLAHVRRALHRSRARTLVLLELDAQEICYVGQLERATGLRPDKIRAALRDHAGLSSG